MPEAYVGYCGATGNHVQAILDALYAEQLWFLRDVSVVDGCLKVEFWNREPYTYALPLVQGTPPEDGGEYYRERAESFVRLVGGHREMERHDQPGMPRNIFIDDPDQSKAESVEQMQASVTALLEHECSKAAGQALYELLTKAQEFMHVPDYPGLPDVERAWWILSDRLREGPERRWEAARYHRKGGSPEAVVWALQWRWNLPDGVRPPPSAQGLKDGAWLVWTHQQEATIWSDDVFRDNFEPYVEPPTELRYYRARDVDTGLFWNAREGKWSMVGTLYSENDRRRLPDPRMFKEGNAPRWEVDAVGAVYNPSGGGGGE